MTPGPLTGLHEIDVAAYRAVAGWHAPEAVDHGLRRLSGAADYSRLWFGVATGLALAAGPRGRAASLTGVSAIAVTSLLVNQPLKHLGARPRPDRVGAAVPVARWVRMPTSTSFPSGHSASAAAFAVAVGDVIPSLRWPLGLLAATVGFTRTYTGVHYPGDVLVGASAGGLLGRLTSRTARRLRQGPMEGRREALDERGDDAGRFAVTRCWGRTPSATARTAGSAPSRGCASRTGRRWPVAR